MSQTANLQLNVYPSTQYVSTKSREFIQGLAGESVDSNMQKLDTAIAALQSGKADVIDGKVPASQLPSYVDDVLEGVVSEDLTSFILRDETEPCAPETGKIYTDISTNKTYRWGGTVFAQVGSDLALGETENTAYRGDRGKAAYDHTLNTENPHSVTKAQIGLGDVDNTPDMDKPISTAQQAALDAITAQIGDIGSMLDAINVEVI